MLDRIAAHVRVVPDFPKPGILFRDLTPLLADGPAFQATTAALAERAGAFDLIAGIEARGFLFGAALAQLTGAGLVIVRKPGKEPAKADILAFMDGKVAKWWMPDDVAFVTEIPHTATGKLSKLQLRERLRDYRFSDGRSA